jgi:hypothetical protein
MVATPLSAATGVRKISRWLNVNLPGVDEVCAPTAIAMTVICFLRRRG